MLNVVMFDAAPAKTSAICVPLGTDVDANSRSMVLMIDPFLHKELQKKTVMFHKLKANLFLLYQNNVNKLPE